MEIRFNYNKTKIIFNFIVSLILVSSLLVLFVSPIKKSGYFFIGVIFVITFQLVYNNVRSFIRFLGHKPAVILTDQYYIDYLNNIKFPWSEIETVKIKSYWAGRFLLFDIKNKSVIFSQISNPIMKLLIQFESFVSKANYKTNISNIDSSDEIFENIINRLKK